MNLYIGNLNYRAKEADLVKLLEEYGTVSSVRLITDRETRRSKGFAFAEMPNDEEAQKAIEALNEQDFMDRAMVIKVALPREQK